MSYRVSLAQEVRETLFLSTCPNETSMILSVMNTNHIINDYIEALQERAEQSGDGRLDYAMGFLYSTLKNLKLQSYELEQLQLDIKNLRKLATTEVVS